MAVVGAGVIGCEYASIFAALGVRVTLVDKRDRLLPFVDDEIADALCHHLRENRVTLRLDESVNQLEIVEDEHGRARPAASRQRQDHPHRKGALFGRPHRRHRQAST